MDTETAARTRPWLALVLLCAMSVMSYLDRYILGLVADPLMKSLAITQTQFGMLVGAGFGIVYVCVGVPLATMLDRGVRVRIVATGVAGWSLCTMASAFAPSYGALLALRSGVALGEACLTPAAVSLIADLFPGRTTRPTAIFMGIAAVMGTGALAIGGATYQLAGQFTHLIEPWRGTLLLVGIPGVLLAGAWLVLVPEPQRREVARAAGENSLLRALAFVWRHGWFFVPFLLAVGLSSTATYAYFTWIAPVLQRSFHFSVAEAGYWQGTLGFAGAVLGAVLWPWLVALCDRKGIAAGLPLVLCAALTIAQVMLVLLSATESRVLVLAFSTCAAMLFGASGTLPIMAVQRVAPPWFHAKIVSFYVLTSVLTGLVCGPVTAGWLAEHVFEGADAIRSALSLMGAVLAPVVAVLLLVSARNYGTAREASA